MKAWLWQFMAGCVTIKIEGLKLLAFISEAAARGIRLACVERESYSRVVARVSWRDYRRLLALARNKPLRVVELSESGLPGIAKKAIRRLAFSIGMIACVAALVMANMHVLDVRVTGLTKPGLEAKVREIASGQGLKPGAAKASLDLHKVEKALMLQIQEISFAAIRVNGFVATVNIVEGVPAPQLIDRSKPCNVLAGRDGIVRKIVLYEGQVRVAEGDAVRRGQVLVDSAVTLPEGVKLVHARADVLASIWYEGRVSAPLFSDKSIRTGASTRLQRLEFAGIVLPVGGQGPAGFDRYETEETSTCLLGPGLKGPRLVTVSYYETRPAREEKDFKAALDTALQQALHTALSNVPDGVQVLGSRTDYGFTDGSIVVRVFVETLENIAVDTPVS